jgi:AraC-like DNA-binding protein
MSLYKILNSFEHRRNENAGLAVIELSLKLMLQEMLITVSNDSADLKKPVGEKSDHKFIAAITQYLYNNIKKPIQIADIAEKMHISKSHLRNKFKDIMGLSIGKYLQNTRIHRACTLLSGSNANISEIALECGFDSLYSFSRAFKNEMGISPSMYRK